ncbi:MAG: DUF1810 domain-containing protein [Bacteroidota bacterium]
MANDHDLQRFIDAQVDYVTALAEIRSGKKRSHWMWYIFPQITGLGSSTNSKFYSIKSMEEARAFIQHPILGARLLEISEALVQLNSNDASAIFGSPDDLKLKSSMTLFGALPGADTVFQSVLDKFFNGEKDSVTLEIISNL